MSLPYLATKITLERENREPLDDIHFITSENRRLQKEVSHITRAYFHLRQTTSQQIQALRESLAREKESQRPFRQIRPSFRFAYLPAELRRFIWEFSLPGPQVLRVTERCAAEDVEMFFCSARPPALLHACRESRYVASAHYKPFFRKGNSDTIPRPIYFRPKIDILFLDFYGPEGIDDFVLRHPDANKIESIAIRAEHPYSMWVRKDHEDGEPKYSFLGMKRLLSVNEEAIPKFPSNRCCASVELLPLSGGIDSEWTEYIAKERQSGRKVPDIEVKAVEAKFFRTHCY